MIYPCNDCGQSGLIAARGLCSGCVEKLLRRLESAAPEGGRKYLGTFLGFKVYEDPTLEEGEFRLQNDAQLTNEMLELEKLFAPSPLARSQEKT